MNPRLTLVTLYSEKHNTAISLGEHTEPLVRGQVFLQKFIALENSLCTLFANDARRQLHDIFVQFGAGIKTVCQLRNAIYTNFFGGFTG